MTVRLPVHLEIRTPRLYLPFSPDIPICFRNLRLIPICFYAVGDIYSISDSVIVWLGERPQLLSAGVTWLESARGDIAAIEKHGNYLRKWIAAT
ncbi:hypothetical protein F5Y15DRAFT_364130 [Xylariaceae sp. FL0016]|nr:hypothetical protein F5Y15DRAFT_364130 [Xylariaceae sp. FL0016]